MERRRDACLGGKLDALEKGLQEVGAPKAAKVFVSTTFDIVEHGQLHTRASALLYGREQLIPPMFKSIVRQLHETSRRCTGLLYYLERHIEVDENDHSVKAERLLARLCGSDPQMWEDARRAAHLALRGPRQQRQAGSPGNPVSRLTLQGDSDL